MHVSDHRRSPGDGFVVFAVDIQLAMTIFAVMCIVCVVYEETNFLHLVLREFVGAQQC